MAVNKDMPVLVVDDYASMVRIVRGMLNELGFKNIDSAANGEDAFEKIQTTKPPYELILSDWNMQPVSGLELLKKVRGKEETVKTPFVMVTAEAKVENVMEARKAGVNNYIIKPFTTAVLKQKLSTVLGEI